jgi:hypothetical protein
MEKVNCEFLSKALFPTPVGIYNFGATNHELNCELVQDSLKERELDPKGRFYSNFKGWHSHFGLEIKYNSFEKLKRIIESTVKHYCNFYGYDSNIKCHKLWSNLSQKTSYNRIHHHGTSYLTGVYYPAKSIVNNEPTFNYSNNNNNFLIDGYSFNEEGGGSLYFLSPSYSESRTLIKEGYNQYNTDVYHMNPVSSALLVFPSYLLHGVEPLHEDYTRISISFIVTLECDE